MATTLLEKSNRPLFWILGLMAGGFLALGLVTYQLIQSPSPAQELEKLTVTANRETLEVEIEASGTVEPIQSVNISPKNPGILKQLLVEQGMPVKKGQTLAVMDNQELYYQGIQAEAKAKEALANLEQAKQRIPEEIKQLKARSFQAQANYQSVAAQLKQTQEKLPRDIEQARAQLKSAESRYLLAEARVKRNQTLINEGAISQDQFDEVANDYLNAKASLVEALERFEQTKNTASPEIESLKSQLTEAEAQVYEAKFASDEREKTAQSEIAQLQAALLAAQAELKRIEVQFKDTVITAPFDGVVTQKYATVGAFVTPTTSASSTASATSTSILALARGLKVIAKVPEVDIGRLKLGQLVRIVADAYPDEVFQGQVVLIAPEAIVEENVTSFEVTIALAPGQEKLMSKMNVDVTFIGQQISDALVVPTVAIVTQEGETGVMVPDENQQPKFQPVSIGLVLDDKTQILSGLEPGERVFIDLPEDKGEEEE